MKKQYKILLISTLVFIVALIIFGIYYGVYSTNKNDNKIDEKVLAEIEYLDEKLVLFFNEMNNVEFESYKLVVQNLNEANSSSEEKKLSESSNLTNGESNESNQSQEKSSENSEENKANQSSESEEKSSSNQSSEASSSNSSQESSQNQGTSENNSSKEQTKEYSMEDAGILVDSKDIKWEKVQTQIENLYVSIPTITLDVYKATKNQEEILNFNSQFDELTVAIKNEDKEETLSKLVNVYETMNNIVNEISNDETKKIIYKTKLNLLKAYSKLDSKKWDEISNDINLAVQEFSALLTNIDIPEEKQYAINKIYIMLNEMINSIQKQDTDVFLIKYKNLLEDLNNI